MTTDLEKEREAFEAAYAPIFVSNNVANMPRRQSGEYVAPQQQIAWMMWQARAALAAPAAPQSVPSFNARQISLKQRGAKIVLTLELDAIEGAPQYIVTPVNPAVVRQAAPQEQPTMQSELKACPRYEAWKHLTKHGTWPNGVPDWARELGSGRVNMHLVACLVIEELGAALAAPAAPQEQPSDEDILQIFADVTHNQEEDARFIDIDRDQAIKIATILLSRYGAAPQPAGRDAREIPDEP